MADFALGIDIGGTKTALCISDKSLNIYENISFPTNPEKGAENLVLRISDAFFSLCEKINIKTEQVTHCGVACPGPLDLKKGMIVHIATMGFRNIPIKAMLEKALNMPVFLENDASLAAYGEYSKLNNDNLKSLVYVTISTGVGCGIIIDGEILSKEEFDSELGHYTVEKNGRKCPCGKSGCLELYSSGTSIAKSATEILKYDCDAKTAFSLARSGNNAMIALINDATDKLAAALNELTSHIVPDIIILGGSVTKDSDLFLVRLKNKLENYEIKISELQGLQGLVGAVAFGNKNYESR